MIARCSREAGSLPKSITSRFVTLVRLEHAGARRPASICAAGKPEVADHNLERAVVVARARDEVGVEVAHDDDRASDVTGVWPEVHREVVDEQPLRSLGLHHRAAETPGSAAAARAPSVCE